MISNSPWGKTFSIQKIWGSYIFTRKKGINLVIWHLVNADSDTGTIKTFLWLDHFTHIHLAK